MPKLVFVEKTKKKPRINKENIKKTKEVEGDIDVEFLTSNLI